ncbi:MAG: hypothetical protein WCO56_15495 [Verrucomicrobiota bacterium]
MHCQLESIPGFELLACCNHPGETPHQDNDCREDSCTVVESVGCFITNPQLEVCAPALLAVTASAAANDELARLAEAAPVPDFSPPGLDQRWQFLHRCALPVRAPSFVS